MLQQHPIKTLWIGPSLSLIEQLSLRSFLFHGHSVELFTYGEVQGVPSGVTLRNANDILPQTAIFKSAINGSYAVFADWFRYEMLFLEGGIWVDLDVVCLKPFDFERRLIVAWEEFDRCNNAVLGGDKGMPLFRWLADQCKQPNKILPYDNLRVRRRKLKRKWLKGNRQNAVRWGETGPLGLTSALAYFDLQELALKHTAFYPIHYRCWTSIFDQTYGDIENYFPDTYAIHLWHEMFRNLDGFDKSGSFESNSIIEQLKRRYL